MQIRSQRPSHDEAVVIRRAAALDPALSLTALGILTRVLGSVEGGVTFEALAVGERPGVVQEGLEQLRAAGYLFVDAEQVYRLSDTPQPPPDTVIAASTTPSPPRPVLTPVPDPPEQDLLPPVRQLRPLPGGDRGPERPLDAEEARRIAQRGAAHVREALARTLEQHEARRREDRDRIESARRARLEAAEVARDAALAVVRRQADQKSTADPTTRGRVADTPDL